MSRGKHVAPQTRRSSDDAAQACFRLVGRGSLLVALAGLAARRGGRVASAIARSAGMTQVLAALDTPPELAGACAASISVRHVGVCAGVCAGCTSALVL
jgi:hypothetical protein